MLINDHQRSSMDLSRHFSLVTSDLPPEVLLALDFFGAQPWNRWRDLEQSKWRSPSQKCGPNRQTSAPNVSQRSWKFWNMQILISKTATEPAQSMRNWLKINGYGMLWLLVKSFVPPKIGWLGTKAASICDFLVLSILGSHVEGRLPS